MPLWLSAIQSRDEIDLRRSTESVIEPFHSVIIYHQVMEIIAIIWTIDMPVLGTYPWNNLVIPRNRLSSRLSVRHVRPLALELLWTWLSSAILPSWAMHDRSGATHFQWDSWSCGECRKLLLSDISHRPRGMRDGPYIGFHHFAACPPFLPIL